MNLAISVLALLCLIGNSGCKKETTPEALTDPFNTPTMSNAHFRLKWQRNLCSNGDYAASIKPIITREGHVLMSCWGGGGKAQEVFRLFHGETGEVLWEWSDFLRPEYCFCGKALAKVDDNLLLNNHNALYAFNLNTGTTNWRYYWDTMYANSCITVAPDGYFYKVFQGEKGTHRMDLARAHSTNLGWEFLLSIYDSSKVFDALSESAVAFTRSSSGHDLLLVAYGNGGSYDKLVKALAYDITSRKVLWHRDYHHLFQEFSVCDPKVYQGKFFTYALKGGKSHTAALNIENGDVIWYKQNPDLGVSLLLYKEILISLHNEPTPIIAYDQQTGREAWRIDPSAINIPNQSFGFHDACIYKNFLIVTQQRNLLVIDVLTGKVAYNEQLVDMNHEMRFGVAINPGTGFMYLQDGNHVNCYELPDNMK